MDKCVRAGSLIASLRLGLGTDWVGHGLVASPLAGQAGPSRQAENRNPPRPLHRRHATGCWKQARKYRDR